MHINKAILFHKSR